MPPPSTWANTASTSTSPVANSPMQKPTIRDSDTHTQPLVAPAARCSATEVGVMPSAASRSREIAFSRVAPLTSKREGHVVLHDRPALMPQGFRLRSPHLEARPLVEPLGLRGGGSDGEMHPRHSRQCSRVLECGLKQSGSYTPAALAWGHVHAPDVSFVGGLHVSIAHEAHRADQPVLNRAQDHPSPPLPKPIA